MKNFYWAIVLILFASSTFSQEIILSTDLLNFNVYSKGWEVVISWSTFHEINNSGFSILLSENNNNWKQIAFIEGGGTTTDTLKYLYIDKPPKTGMYYYRLKQIDYDGTFTYLETKSIYYNLPVEIKNLSVFCKNTYNVIQWESIDDSNAVEYKLQRCTQPWIYEDVATTKSGKAYYTLIDNNLDKYGYYIYRIKIIGESTSGYSDTIGVFMHQIEEVLSQNYPNPVESITTINYSIQFLSDVKVVLYNILGQEVYAENLGIQDSGYHNYVINCSTLSSGVYFYAIKTDRSTIVNKLQIIK